MRERFWLNEVRDPSHTGRRCATTSRRTALLGEGDHYELFVNPYAGKSGEHRLVVTRRADCPEPTGQPPDKLERHPLTELQAQAADHRRAAAAGRPPLARAAGTGGSTRCWPAMADSGYADVSYKVFNIGEANRLPAYSMELGIGLEDNRHLEAVDRILAIAAERRKGERLVHTLADRAALRGALARLRVDDARAARR